MNTQIIKNNVEGHNDKNQTQISFKCGICGEESATRFHHYKYDCAECGFPVCQKTSKSTILGQRCYSCINNPEGI